MSKKIGKSIVDFLIHLFIYLIVLYVVSKIFKTIDIDYSYYGIYVFISSIIIYVLNKTVKPLLVKITIPITGITLGLFYPCINVVILKITDIILGSHFNTFGFFRLFFIGIIISISNHLIDDFIIKPIERKCEK